MRRLLIILAAVALTASCAPSKAFIDYTASEGIIWPGPPESPRIKYLWSLKRVAGEEGKGSVADFLAGQAQYDVYGLSSAETLINPHGLFVNRNDVLYVADPGANRVTIVDLNTLKTSQIDSIKGQPLVSPVGVVAGDDGTVYVTDPELGKAMVFNSKGKFVRYLQGEFKRPTGIAINTEKKLLYVVDTWDHKVYIYDTNGTRIGSMGRRGDAPGEFNYPTHVAVDAEGNIYVSDTLNFRVQVFTPTGMPLSMFGLLGDTYDSFEKIKGISVDKGGHIFVVDSAQDMVKVYDRSGRILLFFGKEGQDYGDFAIPSGIYIDSKDKIFVSDSFNARVQVFQFLGGE